MKTADGCERNEIPVGVLETTSEKTRLYAELTEDFNPIHLDEGFAALTPFKVPIVHGTMGLNLIVDTIDRAMAGIPPGTVVDVRFIKPVPVGAIIRASARRVESDQRYQIDIELPDGQRAVDGTCTIGSNEPVPGNPDF